MQVIDIGTCHALCTKSVRWFNFVVIGLHTGNRIRSDVISVHKSWALILVMNPLQPP